MHDREVAKEAYIWALNYWGDSSIKPSRFSELAERHIDTVIPVIFDED